MIFYNFKKLFFLLILLEISSAHETEIPEAEPINQPAKLLEYPVDILKRVGEYLTLEDYGKLAPSYKFPPQQHQAFLSGITSSVVNFKKKIHLEDNEFNSQKLLPFLELCTFYGIKSVKLKLSYFNLEDLENFLRSSVVINSELLIQQLDLSQCLLAAKTLETLAQRSPIYLIQKLYLGQKSGDSILLSTLIEFEILPQLELICLENDADIKDLAQYNNLPFLSRLLVQITSEASLAQLMAAPFIPQLTALMIGIILPNDVQIKTFFSQKIENLEALALAGASIKDDLVLELLTHPNLENLITLALMAPSMSAECLKNIAFHLLKLRDLRLDLIQMTDMDLNYIVKISTLTKLTINSNQITDRALEIIASSSNMTYLSTLDLSSRHITDVGVIALANSPYIRYLRLFSCKNVKITAEAAVALVASNRILTTLDILNMSTPIEIIEGLVNALEPYNLSYHPSSSQFRKVMTVGQKTAYRKKFDEQLKLVQEYEKNLNKSWYHSVWDFLAKMLMVLINIPHLFWR